MPEKVFWDWELISNYASIWAYFMHNAYIKFFKSTLVINLHNTRILIQKVHISFMQVHR